MGVTDADQDGFAAPVDCNDNAAYVHPGAPEIANGVDDDCNGLVDDADVDGDGFTWPQDCNDGNRFVNPAASEVADGIDNNCNGVTDKP